MTIILLEKNGDLSFYRSVDETERSMESIDIERGEYLRAYDEVGNLFEIQSRGTKKGWFGGLSPSTGLLKPTGTQAPKELYDLLHRRFGDHFANSSPSLQDLVLRAEEELSGKAPYSPS